MSEMYAGLLATGMMLSLCAALHGCLCAFYYKMPHACVACPILLIANLAPLSVLVAHLPEAFRLNAGFWTAVSGLLFVASGAMLIVLLRWINGHVSRISIKESCDRLPAALCFAQENGRPRLMNLRMDELCHTLTGEALSDADHFWTVIAGNRRHVLLPLPDGRTWSFQRTPMRLNGETVYQIIVVDVTAEAWLNRQLDEENARLSQLNARLKQYGKNVEAVVREKEILLAKAHIHDEMGRALLRTRRLLTQGQEDGSAVREAWRQNIHLICSPLEEAPGATSLEQLTQAASAIGVEINRQGELPPEGTEAARLVEAAAHECLTNLVRHAGGSRLEMTGRCSAHIWHIEYRNDGAAPAGPIAEGGGLSSLRRRIEASGGTMTLCHAPRFLLALELPEEMEVHP